MKTTAQLQTDQSSHRSAAESDRPLRETKSSAILDNRPEAVAQRRLAEAIHNSPSMVAQRRQLRRLFGEAAQLKGGPEEEELLQGKFEGISSVQLKEEAPKQNGTGLPDNLKSGIESLSGLSMDNVNVHYNSAQPARLNALAYTQGTDIHVAPGQEKHLPHEAWHVVQQAQGRVKPTMQMKDEVSVNDDQGLEHEADVMGCKALSSRVQLKLKYEPTQRQAKTIIQGVVIQRQIDATKLKVFIDEVVSAILKEDYRTAYMLLTNYSRVSDMGLSLSAKAKVFDPQGTPDYSENMFYTQSDRVNIATVFLPQYDILADENKQKAFKKEYAGYWKPLVMGNLEEFMHAYQKASGGFLSTSTEEFKSAVPQEQQRAMSFNEIDILAQMHEWKLAPQALGFVKAHAESRGPYWEWLTGEKYVPEVVDDDLFEDFDWVNPNQQ